jgi:hypothetical protein
VLKLVRLDRVRPGNVLAENVFGGGRHTLLAARGLRLTRPIIQHLLEVGVLAVRIESGAETPPPTAQAEGIREAVDARFAPVMRDRTMAQLKEIVLRVLLSNAAVEESTEEADVPGGTEDGGGG